MFKRLENDFGEDVVRLVLCLIVCSKSGLSENDKPKFFVNGKEIPFSSCKTLHDLQINDNGRIEVVISKNLVAAF